LSESSPPNLACTRRITVGSMVMGGSFQSSTAVSVTLGSVSCGGTLQTGTAYSYALNGSVWSGTPQTRFLIDLTNDDGDAFPGADFGTSSLVYGGRTQNPSASSIFGNMTAWLAWNASVTPRLLPGTASNCSARTNGMDSAGTGKVTFSTAGSVTVRLAWATSPATVWVSTPCKYTVSAAAVTPKPSAAHVATPALAWTTICAMAILSVFTATRAR
jgi:hypothetical protein